MHYSAYLGIDISKEWFDVALLRLANPQQQKHKQFANNEKGFKSLIRWLTKTQSLLIGQLFVCMEHTGVYTVPLCQFLSKKSMTYTLVPGAEITHSLGITRGKNDKLDAQRIARYAYKNREDIRIHTLPNEAIRILKTLLSHRERIVKARHAFQVSSEEIKAFESSNVFQQISLSAKKTQDYFQIELRQVEKAIDQCLKDNPRLNHTYELLLSVPGIGRQNALYMIVITQNFVSFNCPRKFAAYAGIAPFKNSSGKSKHSKSRVSHKANKKMKTLLTSAVVTSLQTCAEYRLYYEKQLKRGKTKNSIKNVLRNKIVARAFAVVTRDSPYVNTHAFAS